MGASDSNFHEVCTLRDCPPGHRQNTVARKPRRRLCSPAIRALPSPHRSVRSTLSFCVLTQTVWLLCPAAFVMLVHQQSRVYSPCCTELHVRVFQNGLAQCTNSLASSVGLLQSAASDVSPHTLRTDSMTSGKLLNFLCLSLSRKNGVSNSTALTGSLPRVTELAANTYLAHSEHFKTSLLLHYLGELRSLRKKIRTAPRAFSEHSL